MAGRAIEKLAAVLLCSALAMSGTWARAETAIDYVVIPFDPPPGKAFTYLVKSEKYSDDPDPTHKPQTPATVRQQLSYVPNGDGFLMTFKTLAVQSGNTVLTPDSPFARREGAHLAWLLAPIEVEVDQSGEPLRVRDWATWRARLATLPVPVTKGETKTQHAETELVMAKAIEPYLKVDETHAFPALVKHWPSVLGWGGTELEASVPQEFSGEVQSPVAPVMIPQSGALTLSRNPDGDIVLDMRQVTPPGAIGEATRSYFGSIGEAVESGRAKFEASLAKVYTELEDASIVDHLQIVFDGETGMVRTALIEREVAGRSITAGERTTIGLVE